MQGGGLHFPLLPSPGRRPAPAPHGRPAPALALAQSVDRVIPLPPILQGVSSIQDNGQSFPNGQPDPPTSGFPLPPSFAPCPRSSPPLPPGSPPAAALAASLCEERTETLRPEPFPSALLLPGGGGGARAPSIDDLRPLHPHFHQLKCPFSARPSVTSRNRIAAPAPHP